MKKALLFAFILFLVLANVPVTKAERIVFPGIKLGGNLNWASWDPEPPLGEVKTGISYNLGGMVDIDISRNFGIEVDLLYNSVKTRWEYSEFNPYYGILVDYDITWTLGTLSLPVLAKVKFPLGGVTPFLGAGPELGFILSHKARTEVILLGVTGESTTDIMDITESMNFAVTLCAGLEIIRHPVKLVPELRFSLGLTDIDKTWSSAKNSQLLFLLGAKF